MDTYSEVVQTTDLLVAPMPPQLSRAESSQDLGNLRPQRPLLPKIDPSVACQLRLLFPTDSKTNDHVVRPPAFHGELTPASSGHSSMVSPVSATSGSKPLWPSVGKGSIPGPRRPPSPELSNLDCAFPPFTITAKANTARRRERATTQRSDSSRSKSREAPRPLRQDSRQASLVREGSSNSRALLNENETSEKQSRPSTPSSRTQSVSNESDHDQKSVDKLPEAHTIPPEEQSRIRPLEVVDAIKEPALSPPIMRMAAEPDLTLDAQPDRSLGAFDFGSTEINTYNATDNSNDLTFNSSRIEERPRAETEPAYKSKRPPPIASDHERIALARMRPPTTPQPPSGGVFSVTFGRLFGRRPSQPNTPRREVARQALSDEPDIYEEQSTGRSILSPGSEPSFLTAEPSPITNPHSKSPVPSPIHEESLQALEGMIPAPSTTPIVVVESTDEDRPADLEAVPAAQDKPVKTFEPATILEDIADLERSLMGEAIQRASIDSASSYGSVGFSERTTSSRATSPYTDSLPLERSDSSLPKPVNLDVPAALRPRLPDTTVDSPTDPHFQQGRLSPIPDSRHQSDELSASTVAVIPEPEVKATSSVESTAMVKPKPRKASSNKGTCRGCSQVILASQKSVSSADGRLSGRYHKECFVCRTCNASFPTAEFYVHKDHPFCAYHYHELENSLCASCGKGVEGLYMETANVAGRGKEKHHPECLKCTTCRVRLDHDYFELSGKVYCERDAFRLASVPKSRDNAPSRPSPLVREYISSGQDPGLVRGRNFPERRTTKLMTMT